MITVNSTHLTFSARAYSSRTVALLLLAVAIAACRPPGDSHSPAVDAAVDGASGSSDAPLAQVDGGPPPACTNAFRLAGYAGSSSVWLSGDFLSWPADPGAGALALTLGTDSVWTVSHGFAQGTYLYKFIVDGSTWISDPANSDTVPDGDGGVNSVYTCTP